MITSGLATDFYDSFQQLSAENVLRFMILDAANTSSIYCCLRSARESARAVRGAITSEMYEDLNSAWLDVRTYDYNRIQSSGVSEFLEWVKMRSHLFRGVTFGTMLRDEAYHFIRLGTHIERADNTHASSTSSTTPCCRLPPTSAVQSIITSGVRYCARSRASSRIARSTAT